jgi:hypothetical protein
LTEKTFQIKAEEKQDYWCLKSEWNANEIALDGIIKFSAFFAALSEEFP